MTTTSFEYQVRPGNADPNLTYEEADLYVDKPFDKGFHAAIGRVTGDSREHGTVALHVRKGEKVGASTFTADEAPTSEGFATIDFGYFANVYVSIEQAHQLLHSLSAVLRDHHDREVGLELDESVPEPF